MVKIFFFYRKILDNVLLRTFPTPPEKISTPLNFLNPPPPHGKFLKSPPPPPHENFSTFPKKISQPPPENFSTPLKKSQPPKNMLTINPPHTPPPPLYIHP